MKYTPITIMILIIVILLGGFVYPYKTVNIKNFKITSQVERPMNVGSIVTVSWEFTKYVSIPANYAFSLVPYKKNGMNFCYLLQSGTVNSPKGTFSTSKLLKISEEVDPGEYLIRINLNYHVNPIRQINKEFITENTIRVIR